MNEKEYYEIERKYGRAKILKDKLYKQERLISNIGDNAEIEIHGIKCAYDGWPNKYEARFRFTKEIKNEIIRQAKELNEEWGKL